MTGGEGPLWSVPHAPSCNQHPDLLVLSPRVLIKFIGFYDPLGWLAGCVPLAHLWESLLFFHVVVTSPLLFRVFLLFSITDDVAFYRPFIPPLPYCHSRSVAPPVFLHAYYPFFGFGYDKLSPISLLT